ncbi:MAG: chorismate mutase [Betaproteobacteria bacterium]|nr:chorismate mutase [Betaproteobacteria bacterium]
MTPIVECASLAKGRRHIDRIDGELVALIADRGAYVRQAAGFKKQARKFPSYSAVAQALAKVNVQVAISGADPTVADATWRAVIGALIACEHQH